MPENSNAAQTTGGVLSIGQTVLGTIQAISGANRAKRLMGQRVAYHTPEEINRILQAATNLATSGYDPATLNFLTGSADRAFGKSIGTALRLGGDPNDVAALFDLNMQNIMKIGAENQALNMNNFSKYLEALNLRAGNKAAEWKSQQDIIKDQLQAAAADKAAGIQNILSGVNAFIGTLSSGATSNLYGSAGGAAGAAGGGAAAGDAAAVAAASDIRLKENYWVIGKSKSGINIYEFSYKGDSRRFQGAMAHEVPEASFELNGYLWIDYSKIDVQFKQL